MSHKILYTISVLPALLIMPDASARIIELVDPITARQKTDANIYIHSNQEVKGVSSTLDGGVFWAKLSTFRIDNMLYENNTSEKSGGVLYMGSSTQAIIDNSSFVSNTAAADGGAIFNIGRLLTLNNVDFIGNAGRYGGAIYAKGTKPNTITGGSFVGNKATAGGAIYFELKGKQLDIDGTLFENNSATAAGGAMGLFATSNIKNAIIRGNTATEGGALFLGSESHTVLDNVVFDGNVASETGGAIKTRIAEEGDTSLSSMTITNGEFNNNTAAIGGAIHNSMSAEGAFSISGTSFTGNQATIAGGAIYNLGNMTIDNATFADNSAVQGGAIFNMGTLNVTNTTFENNVSDYLGGAMTISNGTVNLDNVKFLGNHSQYGGAIFTYSVDHTLNIKNSLFEGNWAEGVGALQAMYNANIENTVFRKNRATTDSDGGGALFVGAVGKVVLDGVTFEENTATERGGAISTRSADLANNQDARLDILNSVFTDNVAGTTGGALDNYLYSSQQDTTAVYIDNATFTRNQAREGGAIYNHGEQDKGGNTSSVRIENSNFMNNVATTSGGAIYNASGLTLAGENVFSGNRASGVLNDIYNNGTVVIESGTTTLDGGVRGDGNGTFTVADGATLNLGTGIIEQRTININGVLNADIANAREYGRIFGDVTFGDHAELNLNVSTAGTYYIFHSDNDFAGINAGALFDVQNNGAAGVVISTKDAVQVASENGLSAQAAATMVGLANVGGRMSNASIAAQNALAAGDIEYIEAETAKTKPVNKPVVHSVSTTVQNQVLSLVAARMSGGVHGRSGGDFVTTGSGMWAHGMINRSKLNGAFHGDTRGVAVGVDATFNHKYTFGMGYAHGDTDVHANAQKTDIESDTLFAYAQYKPNKWFINGAFNYTFADYTDKMNVFGVNMSSDHNVDSYGAQLMTGYDFASGVTPTVGARYLHIAQDAYNNGIADIKSADTDFLTGVAGVKYAFDIAATDTLTLQPELRAAATYDFMSDDATATVLMPGAAAYVVNADRLSRFGGEFGIGMSALYRGVTVSLNYDLDLHKDYTSQTGMLKFRYNF